MAERAGGRRASVLEAARVVVRTLWRTSPRRTAAALILTVGVASAPLVLAVGLRGATQAADGRRLLACCVWALVAGLAAVAAMTLHHLAYWTRTEAAEAGAVSLEADVLSTASRPPGLEVQDDPAYADRLEILTEELPDLPDAAEAVFGLLALAVYAVAGVALVGLVNPLLLLLPVAAVPPVLCGVRARRVTAAARERLVPVTRQAWDAFGDATEPRSLAELKVTGREASVHDRHRELWREVEDGQRAGETQALAWALAGQLGLGLVLGGLVLVAVRDAARGQFEPADLVLVLALATQVNQQVNTAVNVTRRLRHVTDAVDAMNWLHDRVERELPRPGRRRRDLPARLRDGIRLIEVSFTYPGAERPALDGISVHLPAGARVAVVGANGSGKSTLVKLLCGLYGPTGGAVLVDGVDLDELGRDAWQTRVAPNFQDFAKLELPAREAVGVGDLGALDRRDRVRDAARRGHALPVVRVLPLGWRTRLGRRAGDGVELSGGQWQRFALSRALMRRDPLLLVMDEPTAALDAIAERRIFEAQSSESRRVGDRTGGITVLVSHRMATARTADLVLVLDRGRLVEAGTHDRLTALGGRYASLSRQPAPPSGDR